jgi:DNA polymerase
MKSISDNRIPHEGPEDAAIFFLGDCPSGYDDEIGRPFMDRAGDFLENHLQDMGIDRDAVRIGHLCNYHPTKNDWKRVQNTPQLLESQQYLREYLRSANHKIIVPMGPQALSFLTGFTDITKRRGSVYKHGEAFVIPMLHPSSCVLDGAARMAFFLDLKKVARVLEDGWSEYPFKHWIHPDVYQLEGILPELRAAPFLSVDIESKIGCTYIRCIGFAWARDKATCIFNDAPYAEGQSPIGPNFRRVVGELLANDAAKLFHNGMFDTIMLEANGFEINNYTEDTMIRQHVIEPELPLGLDYCTSIYTDINYYKDDGKESSDKINKEKLGLYNCKDVIATWLVWEAQEAELDETTRAYYQYKMTQLPLAKHFSNTGLFVKEERRDEILSRVSAKREEDFTVFVGIQQMVGAEPFKVTQHAKVKDFLYKTLELPIKTDREGNVTADEDACVTLIGTVERKLQELKTDKSKDPWKLKLAVLKLLLRIRGQEKLLSSYINVNVSLDGRVRSWYKFWGTETGRWSAGSWYDGTGLNGQTIPREKV